MEIGDWGLGLGVGGWGLGVGGWGLGVGGWGLGVLGWGLGVGGSANRPHVPAQNADLVQDRHPPDVGR